MGPPLLRMENVVSHLGGFLLIKIEGLDVFYYPWGCECVCSVKYERKIRCSPGTVTTLTLLVNGRKGINTSKTKTTRKLD